MRRRYLNSGKERIDLSKPYFAIEALEDGVKVKFNNIYEYCIDDGVWVKGEPFAKNTLKEGQMLYFRATIRLAADYTGIGRFTMSGKCNLSGNIMSLLFGDNFEDKTDLTGYDYVFCRLFEFCEGIVDASELQLPATTLAPGCYLSMFSYCYSMKKAPTLPAAILVYNCYAQMFYNSKLNYIKMLATDISARYCLDSWVHAVSSSGTFVKNANMNDLPTGTSGIPEGWTVENA